MSAEEGRPYRIVVYKRDDNLYDFNVVAPNGEVTEGSLQGFTRRLDAIEAAQRNHPGLVIENDDDEGGDAA